MRVTIKNVTKNEFLFASQTKLDGQRRHAFTWVPGFDAGRDESGQWDVTILPGRRLAIKSVKYREFLFASVLKLDHQRRRALTWVPGFDATRDGTGQWEYQTLGHGVVTLKNVAHREYLFAGVRKLDINRRYALTWIPGFDATRDATGQWEFTTIRRFFHANAAAESTGQNLTMHTETLRSNHSELVFFP